MAIISDGITDIVIEFVDEIPQPKIDKVNKVSSGGRLKQQVGGQRFGMKCKARVTAAKFQNVINLLNNGSLNYYYTTEVDHPLYSNVSQPVPVQVNKIGQNWDNRSFHYIEFSLEGISYI